MLLVTIDFEFRKITYSQHALDQMDLPERDISQREVHDIISKGLRKNDYTMS